MFTLTEKAQNNGPPKKSEINCDKQYKNGKTNKETVKAYVDILIKYINSDMENLTNDVLKICKVTH